MRKVESHEHEQGQRADRSALAEIADLIDEGAYEAASAAAWEVQRDTPGDPAIWLLLTRIDFRREQYAGAMYAARMATRLDPSSSEAWLWLARASVTRTRWRTEGMDAALQATALAPDDPQTWTVLAQLHLVRGACYEAAIAAERAVRVAPSHVDAHRTLGLIATQAEEWSHAVIAFRQVLALKPNDVEARAGLITALQAQDIDPSNELRRYGGPPRSHDTTEGTGQFAKALSDPGPLAARPGVVAMGAVVCIALGVGLGVAVPAIGVLRGLVGATALVLMWLAIWPLRQRPRRARVSPAVAGAVSSPPVPAERSQPDRVDATPERPAVKARPPAGEVAPDVREEPAMVSAKADAAAVERAGGRTKAQAAVGDTRTPARRRDRRGPEPGVPERVERAQRPSTGGDDAQRRPPDESDDLPDSPRDLLELSQIRLAEFDLAGARTAAARLAKLAPDSVEAHRALAAVSLAEQDYAQAEWHYGKVLELEPLDEEAHERLAMAKEGRRREQRPQRNRRRRG